MNTQNEIPLLWYELSFRDFQSFQHFKDLFKIDLKEVLERNGYNAIYFPEFSYKEDYSKVFVSLLDDDLNPCKTLLADYSKNPLMERPQIVLKKYFSDKDVPSKDSEEQAGFLSM